MALPERGQRERGHCRDRHSMVSGLATVSPPHLPQHGPIGTMATQSIGIIVNGATGRIGSSQHLANAMVPIINEGGLALGDDRLMPRLLLVGRDADRLAAVARAHGLADWTTDLD